jgi:hypothetical protein
MLAAASLNSQHLKALFETQKRFLSRTSEFLDKTQGVKKKRSGLSKMPVTAVRLAVSFQCYRY